MVCLETNRDHSVIFEIAPKYCISDSFVDHEGNSISSKLFLKEISPEYSLEGLMLKNLPWKQTEIIVLFLRLHPSTAFQTLLLTEGYFISSKGFLPIRVDTMVI